MRELKNFLELFHFVRWDRYTEGRGIMYIYGWIDRKNDSYKDFIVVEWDKDSLSGGWFVTSSKKYDKEIKKILAIKRGRKCKRVEHLGQIANAIKI